MSTLLVSQGSRKTLLIKTSTGKTLQVANRQQQTLVINARAVIYRERVEIGAEVVEFAQEMPSMVWTVLHNFGRRPLVQVLVDDEVVAADVSHLDLNTMRVTFSTPQSGSTLIS